MREKTISIRRNEQGAIAMAFATPQKTFAEPKVQPSVGPPMMYALDRESGRA
jgi:hypothetical protein